VKVIGKELKRGEPIVLASAALAARWPGLGGVIPVTVSKRAIGREEVVIVGRMAPAALQVRRDAAVVASVTGGFSYHDGDVGLALAGFDPALVETWRRSRVHVRLGGDPVLFARAAPEKAVPLPLARGELPIFLGKARREIRLFPHRSVVVDYQVVWLGPMPAQLGPRPPDERSPPLVGPAAAVRVADTARFLPAYHGKMILLPASLVQEWEGIPSIHEKGTRPFQAAQKVRGVGTIAAGAAEALVVEPDDALGACLLPDGLLLVGWQGASSERAAMVVGLTLPDDAWRPAGRFHAAERDLVMFDSGVAGRKLEPPDRVELRLPATGTYDVEHVPRYGATLRLATRADDEELELAYISAVRLRRSRVRRGQSAQQRKPVE
jgi:hypothetical protein